MSTTTDSEQNNVLLAFIDLLDNRPEDMYDEEGNPTEELNQLMRYARKAVQEP